MSCNFGLYFGNTNLCLAMQKDGQTQVLANSSGDRVTPAIVAFLNGERSVGSAAKHGMYRNAENTVVNIKDLIGCDQQNIEELKSKSKCKIIEKNGLKYEIDKDGKLVYYSSHDILVILFTTMKEIAGSHSYNENTYPVVVTVPLTYTKEHCDIIKEAIEEAGFHLLRIIKEPVAAMLAYDVTQNISDLNDYTLVFRMGGTSLEVTILRTLNGLYSILASVQRNDLGGNIFTNVLVNFCIQEFQRMYKIDVKESKRSLIKLSAAAENCKHVLSTLTTAQCFAESLYDGIDLNINISRARFELCMNNILQKCLEPIHQVLSDAGLKSSDINKVVLAGGSCKIPKLQQLLCDTFKTASILSNIIPDEVIAIGAATQATLISQNGLLSKKEFFADLISQDIYIKVTGIENEMTEQLFSKGTLVPTITNKTFILLENTNLEIEIQEINMHGEKIPIAKVKVLNLPSGEIKFSFHLKNDGSLFVTCKDTSKEIGSKMILPSHYKEYT